MVFSTLRPRTMRALFAGAPFDQISHSVGMIFTPLYLGTLGQDQPLDRLPARLRSLREVVAPREEVGVVELMARTGLSVPECMAGVHELVELGWLEQASEVAWRLPAGRR